MLLGFLLSCIPFSFLLIQYSHIEIGTKTKGSSKLWRSDTRFIMYVMFEIVYFILFLTKQDKLIRNTYKTQNAWSDNSVHNH